MPVDIAVLRVNLVANTASFNGPLDKAAQQAKNSARDIQKDLNSIDTSEARGGLIVLGEEIGVHLPRHVQAFVAELPGVAPALAAAFPILAVLAIGKAIFDATEKIQKHSEEVVKARQEGIDLAESFMRQADAIHITNLKLDDQIAKLRGKPSSNGIVIAMEEGQAAAKKLTDEFQKALDKESELLDKQKQGFFTSLIGGDASMNEVITKFAELDRQASDAHNVLVLSANEKERAENQKTYDEKLAALNNFLADQRTTLANDIKTRAADLLTSTSTPNLNTGGTDVSPAVAKNQAEATQLATAAFSDRARVLSMLTLAEKGYSEAQKENNKHTQDAIALGKGTQRNDASAIAEKQEAFDKQTEANSAKILELKSDITSEMDKHANHLQVITGKMTEQKAIEEEIAAIKKKDAAEQDRINKLIDAQALEVKNLKDASEKPDATAADNDRYQKAFKVYQDLQIKKLEITRTTEGQIEALEDRQTSVAVQQMKTFREMAAQNAAWEERIATLVDAQTDSEIKANAERKVTLGLATEQKAAEEAIKELKVQQAAEMQAIEEKTKAVKSELDRLALKGNAGPLTADEMQMWKQSYTTWENLEFKKLEVSRRTNAEIDALRKKSENTQTAQNRKMFLDWQQLNVQFGNAFRQTIGAMNSNLAQFIVTGQGSWLQFASSAIESFVQIGLQYAESKAAMALLDALFGNKKKAQNSAQANSDAATAAAGTLADAPWPENIPASVAVLAVGEGYAADAMAKRGGVLPNRDLMVHTHPEEMILPQNISNFIVRAVSSSSGGAPAGGGDTHQHMVFAPQIHAVDAQGVDRMLTKHMDVFTRKLTTEFRRRNMKG